MSTTTRQYTIRLSAAGKQQMEADLRALGASGEKSLRRIQMATKPASTGLRETDRAARELKGGLGALTAELPALQRLARFMGTTALVGGAAAFGRSALNVGREFQAMMQRVEAATRAGEADMARLSAAAKELGATTAFTAMEAAEAIEVLAKNGVLVADILGGALDASVSLAGALGGEVAPSADLVTDLMQQFRLEAAQLPMIVDRLTGAAQTSKFGFDDLRLAIAQAGGVAGTFGVEIEDFLTALSATASSFASGSDAGTSFKTFLQRLTPDSAKAAGVMEELGLKFFDAQGNMLEMAEIAGVLQAGLAGLSEEARNEALKTVFGTDAVRTAAALAQTGAAGFRELAEAIGRVSAQEQAEVRMRGLDGALKEVAAAWEALQLEAAQNGGLDVAESFVRRLTEALRFLTENFEQVEEVAERVAQMLAVYLVGKGMTLAIAKGVAMRAALIEIAAATTGVGTAATRATGGIMRLGVGLRFLTGVLGGPLSLAVTTASLLALGVDTDAAADAVERAEAAALKASDALDAYQAASKRAAEEQASLGGEVSETTRQMLEQSKAGLVQALTDAERTLKEARERMSGELFDRDGFDDFATRYRMLFRTNPRTGRPDPGAPTNRYVTELAAMAEQAANMEISATTFAEAFAKVQAIGPGISEAAEALRSILGSGETLGENAALDRMQKLAEASGLFGDELASIRAAGGSEVRLRRGYEALLQAMDEAVVAGRLARSEQEEGFRTNLKGLADAEAAHVSLQERVADVETQMLDVQNLRPFDETAESARMAAGEVERLSRVYSQYQNSRRPETVAAWENVEFRAGAADAAKKGLRDLIGYAEGTDKGRGYNETLDYGRWTGGDVNLVAMTLDEVLALQAKMLADPANRAAYGNGTGSSAVGRYQIVSKTLRGLMAQMGLSGSELFSADLQDQMADILIEGRGRNASGLRAEWQGLNRVSNGDILGAYDIGAGDRAKASAETARERADALAQVVAVGEDMLEQLRLEADLSGRSVEEQARLTFQYEALKRAREQGIDPQKTLAEDGRTLAQVIDEQAANYARLVAAQDRDTKRKDTEKKKAEELAAELEDYKGTIEGLFDNLKPGGDGIEGFWNDLTQMILDKLWSLAFDPVWEYLATLMQGMFSGMGLGGGNIVGSLLGLGRRADGGAMPALAGGGNLAAAQRAAGMLRGTGGKRQDNMLFWGSKGEFMQPASAVDFYGLDFMEDIRNRRIPKYADGGSLYSGSGGSGGKAMEAPVFNFIDRSGGGVDIETKSGTRNGQRFVDYEISDAVTRGMQRRGGSADKYLRRGGFQQQFPRR